MNDIKAELRRDLAHAMTTKDQDQLRAVFDKIVSGCRHLRSSSTRVDFTHPLALVGPLVAPHQQLQCLGVAAADSCGPAVMGFYRARCENPQATSVFNQCFQSSTLADQYAADAREVVRTIWPNQHSLVLFPPLLARATERQVVQLDSQGRPTTSRPSLILVFFAEGPIVPVVPRNAVGACSALLSRLYQTTEASELLQQSSQRQQLLHQHSH